MEDWDLLELSDGWEKIDEEFIPIDEMIQETESKARNLTKERDPPASVYSGTTKFIQPEALQSIFFQDDVISCGGFKNQKIVRVTFAPSCTVRLIEEGAFQCCENLREIEVPATVEEIGDYAFHRCPSLARVTFAPGSVLK